MMTQGVMETQVVQFWYGILDKELRHQVWDAMLFQLTQPTLTNVFQLSKRIKMNMVE
jgi:hypothetical protein